MMCSHEHAILTIFNSNLAFGDGYLPSYCLSIHVCRYPTQPTVGELLLGKVDMYVGR